MPERNNEILSSIESGQIPLLPFELQMAKASLKKFVKQQHDLAVKLGDAMRQSSETWHDNAPAEAISQDSSALVKVAEKTVEIINKAEVFDYNDNSDYGVTLGSIVDVYYNVDIDDTVKLVLTGVSNEIPPNLIKDNANDDSAKPEDLNIITINSPVGKAILGKSINDNVKVKLPNGIESSFTIKSIKNIKL